MLLIIFFLTSLFLIGLGIYIHTRKAVWLLSNFSQERIQDKTGMAKWAAMFLYLFAGFFLAFGFGIFKLQHTEYEIVPVLILILCILLLTISYLVGGQRFLHKGFKNKNSNGRIDL